MATLSESTDGRSEIVTVYRVTEHWGGRDNMTCWRIDDVEPMPTCVIIGAQALVVGTSGILMRAPDGTLIHVDD